MAAKSGSKKRSSRRKYSPKAGKEVKPLIVPTNNPLYAVIRTAKEINAQEMVTPGTAGASTSPNAAAASATPRPASTTASARARACGAPS